MTAPYSLTSEPGAPLIAEAVRRYWSEQGIPVAVRIEAIQGPATTLFVVRSDMLNGAPRGVDLRVLAGVRK